MFELLKLQLQFYLTRSDKITILLKKNEVYSTSNQIFETISDFPDIQNAKC